MKALIAAVVIFVLLIGSGIASYYYLENTANELVRKTEIMEKSVYDKDWKKTEKTLTSLNSSWNRVNNKWTALVDHHELDSINISLSRIREYVQVRELPGLAAELAELRLLLLHIPEKEAINLDNLL